MSKILLFLSLISIVILALGTAFIPNNQIFLFANDSNLFQYVREIIASILFIQIITKPPRQIVFRILAGIIAITVGGWALISTYNGTMPFLDTFAFLASAAAIGITALEVRPATKTSYDKQQTNSPLLA